MSAPLLVTGGGGLLGGALIRHAPPDCPVHATRRSRPVRGAVAHPLDLAEPDAFRRLAERLQPSLIIHTAASMTDGARDIVAATEQVVDACHALDLPLIHLSTDALFDGERAPYAEGDLPDPVHAYGRWKATAEQFVRERLPTAAVVRTSLICQATPLDPRSAWVAESLSAGRPLTLFTDELRCPIHVDDLARQLWSLAALPPPERAGVWHLAGPEALSRYALGLLIAAHQRLDPAGISPAFSAAHPTPRPRDVRLSTHRADRHLPLRARPISATFAPTRPSP